MTEKVINQASHPFFNKSLQNNSPFYKLVTHPSVLQFRLSEFLDLAPSLQQYRPCVCVCFLLCWGKHWHANEYFLNAQQTERKSANARKADFPYTFFCVSSTLRFGCSAFSQKNSSEASERIKISQISPTRVVHAEKGLLFRRRFPLFKLRKYLVDKWACWNKIAITLFVLPPTQPTDTNSHATTHNVSPTIRRPNSSKERIRNYAIPREATSLLDVPPLLFLWIHSAAVPFFVFYQSLSALNSLRLELVIVPVPTRRKRLFIVDKKFNAM